MSKKDNKKLVYTINWKNTLTNYASLSGVFAGFCVTFIALILSGSVAKEQFWITGLSHGQWSVLLFGIAASFFMCASQLFLTARGYDHYDVPEEYIKELERKSKMDQDTFRDFVKGYECLCEEKNNQGAMFYNGATFIIFLGLLFVLLPYNMVIAIFIFGLGTLLELWQVSDIASKIKNILILVGTEDMVDE